MTTTGRPANDRPAFLPIKRWFESGTSTGRLPKSKIRRTPPPKSARGIARTASTSVYSSPARTARFTPASRPCRRAGVTAGTLPWLVIKEFCDNALDSADAAGHPGAVEISVDPRGNLTVTDEGTGIPDATPEQIATVLRRPTDAQQQTFAPTDQGAWQSVEGCLGYLTATAAACHRDRRHPGGTGARDRRHQPHRQQQARSSHRQGLRLIASHRRCAVH